MRHSGNVRPRELTERAAVARLPTAGVQKLAAESYTNGT
jgi:hypothetical protein